MAGFTANVPRWPVERFWLVLAVVVAVDVGAVVTLVQLAKPRAAAVKLDEAARRPLHVVVPAPGPQRM